MCCGGMEKETEKEKERGNFPPSFSSATPSLFPRSTIYFPRVCLSRLIKESETWTNPRIPLVKKGFKKSLQVQVETVAEVSVMAHQSCMLFISLSVSLSTSSLLLVIVCESQNCFTSVFLLKFDQNSLNSYIAKQTFMESSGDK